VTRGGVLNVVALVGAMAAVPYTSARVDATQGQSNAEREALTVWTGEGIKRLAPGFENLMADIYWLRTVQYFGSQRAFDGKKTFDLLRPLVEITTTLDPRLEIAYRYGAIFLSEPWPNGAGKPEEGIAVLEKGTRALPGDWRLYQNLGYFWFLFMHEPRKAAEVLDTASRLPGAAVWLKTLAAHLLGGAGERDAAREMWRQLYEQSERGPMRENAAKRLLNLDALDRVDALEAAAARFEAQQQRKPASLLELGEWAHLSHLDPAGVPFRYDVSTGKVTIDRSSKAWVNPN
jgi:hypothetical protein